MQTDTPARSHSAAVAPPTTPLRTISIVANHLVPVVGTLWFHWSVAQFALLCVFNIVFGIMSVIVVNLAVSQLQTPARPDVSTWGRIEPWVGLALLGVFLTAVLGALFGWIVLAMLPDAPHALADRHLWISVGAMVAAALPALLSRAFADVRAGASEQARKARDQPGILLQVASGFALLVLSSYAVDWFGAFGLYPLMFALTAFFIFRDLRPEFILQRVFARY